MSQTNAAALRTTYWVFQIGSKLARSACGTKRNTRAAPRCAIAGVARAPAPRTPAAALMNVRRSMTARLLRDIRPSCPRTIRLASPLSDAACVEKGARALPVRARPRRAQRRGEILERAKGFEPSTPTLAILRVMRSAFDLMRFLMRNREEQTNNVTPLRGHSADAHQWRPQRYACSPGDGDHTRAAKFPAALPSNQPPPITGRQ